MKRNGSGFLALLFLCGCSGGGTAISLQDVRGTDAERTDGLAELVEPDLLTPPDQVFDLAGEEFPDLETDGGQDTGFQNCEGGGCFGDPCTDNADCQSGFCMDHLGDGICSQTCQTECPPGWSCQQVGTGPDLVFVCVSQMANLCRPCATAGDCKSPGGAEDVCVDYGDEGSFCGGACASDEDCPWGFLCSDVVTVAGIGTWQCVAEAGVCPCASKSVALGLSTPCAVENEFGTCTGLRVCTDEGLSDCDAAVPAAETCNGLDDNCDGDVDEPLEVGGEYVGLCNDDNACTKDLCNGEAGCTNEALTDVECIDGDACTVGDHCEAGVCVGSPVACDDGNPCTDDVCDGFGGCEFNNNTAFCDDGDPCTVGDVCTEGSCAGTPVACDCQVDEDCEALEDGDLCNGTLTCNTDEWPYQCEVVAETIVECPEPAGIDAICLQAVCDPESGACSFAPAHEGLACDDGNPCFVGDVCQEGTCTAGLPANCNDGNPCTDDSCDPETGCLHGANQNPCQDGDACTVGDLCAEGECVPGPVQNCDDGNPCTDDSCDPALGCVHASNTLPCDDNNSCTTGDTCANGQCTGTGTLECDDGNSCTTDICLADGGCAHENQVGPCDDGNACTLNDQCVEGACVSGEAKNCDDFNPCTTDSCGPAGNCEHVADDEAACDDGNACTTGDQCQAGLCVTGGLLNCNDGDVCTDDYCDPATGCIHLLNKAPCDDGDVCTLSDSCNLGECVGGSLLTCNDSNPCTDDLCNPNVGCEFVPNEVACDDGNACTTVDQCTNGVCKGTTPLDCDDGNLCTNDFCDPAQGCVQVNNSSPCDDGDPCTIGDLCVEGLCTPGAPLNCTDQNPCTDDACDPVAGCVFTNNELPCDDGNACTEGDACFGGDCLAGDPTVCNDENLCTDDSCAPDVGCIFTNNTALCDDGNACTVTDQCADGVCVGSGELGCDDSDVCTTDSCDPEQGCLYEPIAPCCSNGIVEAGEECDDGNLVNGDGCSDQCVQTVQMIGTFAVSDGPQWTGNPPCYTCREACAHIFGGNAGQYKCSTVQGSINEKAWLDGWGDSSTYCGGTPGPDTYKKSTYYNCGSGQCSYSAYVSDHGCGKTNYCWKL